MPRLHARAALLAAALAPLLAAAAAGQRAADPMALAHLLTLPGDLAAVRYTPGALDRAAHVQARLALLAEDFRDWGAGGMTLRALVLAPEDWPAADLRRPFGLPERTARGELAAPAWGSAETVALWRGFLGGPLPWSAGEPVRGTPEEAASLALADLVLQVECGHLFVERAALGSREPWVADLVAHVAAHTAWLRHEPQRLAEVSAAWRALAARTEAPPWLVREAQLHAGAEVVVARDGTRAVKRLMTLARRQGALTPGALLRRYPELAQSPFLRSPSP